MGIRIRWKGIAKREVGIVDSVSDEGLEGLANPVPFSPLLRPGQTIVLIDPRYFRPTEVETLLGDPSKAREELAWVPRTSLRDLVAEMGRKMQKNQPPFRPLQCIELDESFQVKHITVKPGTSLSL